MTDESAPSVARKPYPPGTDVEIRNQFDRAWSSGFVVESLAGNGRYFISRTSDGTVLPTEFPPSAVRRVKNRAKNSMWWV
ncbi:MAG TPA: hypothetical protein VMW08_18070 [Acidimicrobiales bacterium]|nr:hypothetical protein [Acidimicrobiales bacterium]